MTNPVRELRVTGGTPIGLRESGAGWMMRGDFRVIMRLADGVEFRRYEYRQFIQGTATTQQGTFPTGQPPSTHNWLGTGPIQNVASAFMIPGGLPRSFAEDGIRVGGRVLRFGYRSATAHVVPGSEDRYLPNQATGGEYRCMDTYGLEGARRIHGVRIRLHLVWQGRVIDRDNHDRIVKRETWNVSGDSIITV